LNDYVLSLVPERLCRVVSGRNSTIRYLAYAATSTEKEREIRRELFLVKDEKSSTEVKRL